MLFEAILPRLKEGDAQRLRAYLEAGGDRKAVAEKLELPRQKLSRQLRQTVFPAVRRLAEEEVLNCCG